MDNIRKLLESQNRDDVIIGINLLSKVYSGQRFIDEMQRIKYSYITPIWFKWNNYILDIFGGTCVAGKYDQESKYLEYFPEQKIEL